MHKPELRELYQQFIDQNVLAFADRYFEIAYHALAAAMHCAEALGDKELLSAVQRSAEEQDRWIEANAPEHQLSATRATQRGNESIFSSLARQCHAHLLGLMVDDQAERIRSLHAGKGTA
jgi:hypothetical protein